MAVHRETYDNVKNTFPLSTALTDWEITFGAERQLVVAYVGSDSETPPIPFVEGDWVYVPGVDYVGLVTRVVTEETLEVKEPHGLTAEDEACAVIRYSTAFKDVSWVINSGSSTPAGAEIDGEPYPDGMSDGGANFIDVNFKPLIIDATGTIVYLKGIY
jgi:hypothetical protein